MKLLKLLAVAFFFSISNSALADEAGVVGERLKAYWRVFSVAQFDAAADFIYPKDLAQAKADFLPIFLDGAKITDPRLRVHADKYFGNVPLQRRGAISDKESYAGINRFIFGTSPELLEMMKGSGVTVTDVKFSSASEATVTYSMQFSNGKEAEEVEQFTKAGGIWYLRLKQVSENAAAVRKVLLPVAGKK